MTYDNSQEMLHGVQKTSRAGWGEARGRNASMHPEIGAWARYLFFRTCKCLEISPGLLGPCGNQYWGFNLEGINGSPLKPTSQLKRHKVCSMVSSRDSIDKGLNGTP